MAVNLLIRDLRCLNLNNKFYEGLEPEQYPHGNFHFQVGGFIASSVSSLLSVYLVVKRETPWHEENMQKQNFVFSYQGS